MSKLIVTGANGFIGSHIVRFFTDKGIRVTCFVRKNSNVDAIKGYDVDFKYGDIRDKRSLVDAFKGHDFVIHNAAYVKDWGDYGTFYRNNVEGTLNVLNACAENDIKDVVMTSTNSVYGEEDSATVKNEDSPYHSHYRYFLDSIFFPCKMNYYRDTKRIAEERAIDFVRNRGINLTLLEPVWVYGENGAGTIFLEYIKSAKQGVLLAPGSRRNKFHVIYAGDLARAYYLAFCKRLKGVQRILVGNSECNLMDDIFSRFCECANVKKPILLPKWIVYPAGLILEALYTVFGAKSPPLLTRGRVNTFYDNIEYSTLKAKQLLGFKNEYNLTEGIRNTVEWYKIQGYDS